MFKFAETSRLLPGNPEAAAEMCFRELAALRAKCQGAAWDEAVAEIASSPVFEMAQRDPITSRAHTKPRGYPGDAILLDLIYGYPVQGTVVPDKSRDAIGRAFYDRVFQAPECESVRWRRHHIADLVEHEASRGNASVLSIACGHLREADLVAERSSAPDRWVGLDQDAASLATVTDSYPWVKCVNAGVASVLKGEQFENDQFDLVYSAGLLDYLDDRLAGALIGVLAKLVKPDGRLLVANFAPRPWSQGYMEACMGWNLIYRDEPRMEQLAGELPHRLYRDPNGTVVYLEISGSSHHCP